MGEAPDARPVPPGRPPWSMWVTSGACLAQRPVPSWPESRSCRGERNSSSWKATTKPSLEEAGHPSRCHPATTPTAEPGVALRDLLVPSHQAPGSHSPPPRLPRHQARGIRQRTSGLSLPGVTSLDQPGSKPLPSPPAQRSCQSRHSRPPRAGRHPLCSPPHLLI